MENSSSQNRRGLPLQSNFMDEDRLVDILDEDNSQDQLVRIDGAGGDPAPMRQNVPAGGSDPSSNSSVSFKYDSNQDKEDKESTHFMSVFDFFDASFLIVINVTNFAQGFRRLLELGLYYLFKDKLGLQPGEITLLLGIMAFPWVCKIFLAIFSDNLTCCGSRRKSYLIINSAINIASIFALMLFGIAYGKEFIMVCIVISQICMTWCDAISDALIAQASRADLNSGAANLNSLCTGAYALGGFIACVCAGFIELDDGGGVDPNFYFGIYAGLIVILLLASIFLNRKLEPEVIILRRIKAKLKKRQLLMMQQMISTPGDSSSTPGSIDVTSDDLEEDTLCASFSMTFSEIGSLLMFTQFSMTLLFFLIQGILVPNFDDLHYIFLTEVVGMPKWEYDFLNSISYVSIVLVVYLFNQFWSHADVWVLVLTSLFLFVFMTTLMLINATRKNIEWGISDEVINGVIFFFGTQSVSILAYVPTQCVLTYLVPQNVEASTMALISGTFIWSYEVGAKISSSIYCTLFEVSDEHMDNYPRVLAAKIPVLFLMMILVLLIPSNHSILSLAAKLRKEHQRKLQKKNKLKLNYLNGEAEEDEDGALLPHSSEGQQEGGMREELNRSYRYLDVSQYSLEHEEEEVFEEYNDQVMVLKQKHKILPQEEYLFGSI